MEKKIHYFVGPYGCGKTTIVNRFYWLFKDFSEMSLENNALVMFLKSPDFLIRQMFYLHTSFYRLVRLMNKIECEQHNVGFFDGHPMLGIMYGRTFFELEHGHTFTLIDWANLTKTHSQMAKFLQRNSSYNNYRHIIYYINIPEEENMKMVLKRGRKDTDEIDREYLRTLRLVISQEIHGLVEWYGAELVEVNNLDELVLV